MRTAAFSLVLFLFAPATPGIDTPVPTEAVPADKPIPPKEAPGKMTVPEGFKVTLFAGEPDVVQPIAFTFDDRGRMWVVECVSYPNWSRNGTGHDRVLIFEDTDGDGTFDKKTVFLDNGVNLSGIEFGFGGVWLCSSPNLLFVPILEGDKPGKPEVVLDGWNMIDTKHNIFNSLGWGPDGWLYGCNGIQAKAWVGPPGTPKEKRTYLDCGVWRYHPTRKVFELVASGTTNPFGLDWDEYGEMFITNCVIDHLFHFVPGGHYERMYGQDANPYVYGLMKSCVDYKHWAGGDWTTSRSTGVGGDPKQSDAGGGHAHSGCAIYLGDNFPAEYRNTLFTCNIHGNRLNNDGLARTPSGMKGVRRKDFLFANDSWFRGICVKVGPDGALYVSDWCDTGECHNYDKCDITNGRIYRVSYGDPKQWKGDVSKLSDAELVKLQISKNEWFVRHARRVLQERAAAGKLGAEPLAALQTMLKEEKDVTRILRAVWALEAMDALTEEEVKNLCNHADDSVRVWAYRLAYGGKRSLHLCTTLYQAGKTERSPFALLALAGSLRAFDADDRFRPAGNLLKREEFADPKLGLMLWYGIASQVSLHPETIVDYFGDIKSPLVRQYGLRVLFEQSQPKLDMCVADLVKEMGELSSKELKLELLRALHEGLLGKKSVKVPDVWAAEHTRLRTDVNSAIRREAEAVAVVFGDEKVIAEVTKRLTDSTATAEDRRAAIELLLPRKQPEFRKTLVALLDDPAVRSAAIRGLAAFADAETPAAILKAYPKFTADEKLDAVNTLAARKEWAKSLLDAVEKKDVPRADIPVTTARQILALNDKALSSRLDTVWGKIAPASQARAALTKKWKELLTDETLAKADPARGRALFAKTCGACHKMFGEGQAVGPELTGSQRANLDYVLENVLDPSAVVPNEYRLINFTLTDERVVGGIILRETKDAVTVRTPNETVVLPAGDIAARKQTNLSLMPDGLFDQIKPDEVRDLVAYLRAKEQVPLPK
jgi:putative membrane-bound dehydrogenase-like protein